MNPSPTCRTPRRRWTDLRSLGRTSPILAALCAVVLLFSNLAQADPAELEVLNTQFQTAAEGGDFEQAMTLAQTLVEVAERDFTQDSAEYADALASLGWVQSMTGDLENGIATLRRSEMLFRQVNGAQSEESLQVHDFLLGVYKAKLWAAIEASDGETADATRSEVLAWIEQTEPQPFEVRVKFLQEDAVQAYTAGYHAEAAKGYELTLEAWQEVDGEVGVQARVALLEYAVWNDQAAGDWPAAVGHIDRLLALIDTQAADLDTARRLQSAGMLHYLTGDYDGALPYLERSLELYDQLAPGGPEGVLSLNWLGPLTLDLEQIETAEEHYNSALQRMEVLSATQGLDYRVEVSKARTGLGVIAYLRGRYTASLTQYSDALVLLEQVHGPNHTDNANNLNRIGVTYDNLAQYSEAIKAYEAARVIYQVSPGFEREYATVTANLADTHSTLGNYDEASQLFFDALETLETLSDAQSVSRRAGTMAKFAGMKVVRGEYTEARELLDEAGGLLETLEKPDYNALSSLESKYGDLYYKLGDFASAETHQRRVLTYDEETLDLSVTDNAMHTLALAQTLCDKGDTYAAKPLLTDAITTIESLVGTSHPALAGGYTNLGFVMEEEGDIASAAFYLERAYLIRLENPEIHDSGLARSLTNLASIYSSDGRLEDARLLIEEAIPRFREVLGDNHPDLAAAINNLGYVQRLMGDRTAAAENLQKARTILEANFGTQHPNLATSIGNQAFLALEDGRYEDALVLEIEALEIQAQALERILSIGSDNEQQLSVYVNSIDTSQNTILSLDLLYLKDSALARKWAFETLLQRKGLVVDTLSVRREVLRRNLEPGDRALFDELTALNEALAANYFSGAGGKDNAILRARVEEVEREFGARATALQSNRLVRADEVLERLPNSTVLIEYVFWRPVELNSGRDGNSQVPQRFAAYAATRDGVRGVDLGELAPIAEKVEAYRKCLRECDGAEVNALGRELHALLIEPLGDVIDRHGRLLISPDDLLNLVPFDSLVDPQGRYLLQEHEISYLGSGRDLVRITERRLASKRPSLILADPSFGPADGLSDSELRGGPRGWQRLTGTTQEAAAIAKLLPAPRLLTGEDASEEALKAVVSPFILHIATHGFFLSGEARSSEGLRSKSAGFAAVQGNPMDSQLLLRSGLVLANANQSQHPGEDGLASARELSTLDLQGTQLVVLSACETGIGAVYPGQGVYGLRRALAVAGAESQVMSLWSVSDEGTRALMVVFYRRLMDGDGTAEALRGAKLELMESAEWAHPFYWAAFIPAGDWRPLNASTELYADKDAIAVQRGCGCSLVVPTPRTPWLGALLFLGVLIMLSTRRRDRVQ